MEISVKEFQEKQKAKLLRKYYNDIIETYKYRARRNYKNALARGHYCTHLEKIVINAWKSYVKRSKELQVCIIIVLVSC